ncbi:hypothetical protein M011DRAFT_456415 [Sporormia fimetaria CBS 119925]|uniref:Uncharacterized protein n=1 Tax=Sporormia fimetaria CBS 119925 TaxID=1340428 RepID=A0A6A6VIU2_9PLEO|nr:hypothetical protein M011DRAFT_456415 [Sporormia fimetaria CBS 119925]
MSHPAPSSLKEQWRGKPVWERAIGGFTYPLTVPAPQPPMKFYPATVPIPTVPGYESVKIEFPNPVKLFEIKKPKATKDEAKKNKTQKPEALPLKGKAHFPHETGPKLTFRILPVRVKVEASQRDLLLRFTGTRSEDGGYEVEIRLDPSIYCAQIAGMRGDELVYIIFPDVEDLFTIPTGSRVVGWAQFNPQARKTLDGLPKRGVTASLPKLQVCVTHQRRRERDLHLYFTGELSQATLKPFWMEYDVHVVLLPGPKGA